MEGYFGSSFSRCFSAPWIKYNVYTKRICEELGLKIFSGGVSPKVYARIFNVLGRAMNLNILGPKEVSYHRRADFSQRGFSILEISVSIDVVEDYRAKSLKAIGAILDRYNQCEKHFDVIGFMLHHWVFDTEDKTKTMRGLLKDLKTDSNVDFRLIEDIAGRVSI